MKLPNTIRMIAAAGVALAAVSTATARSADEVFELSAPSGLQRPAWMATPTNAALLYYRYWSQLSAEDEKAMAEAIGAVSEEQKATWVPSGVLAEKLAANKDYFNGVTKATKLAQADWGVEYDDGFMALIPHLGSMRKCVRLFDADARRLAAKGEHDAAASRVAAIFRMSDHVADGGLLISSLVGAAILNTGVQRVDAALQQGSIDRAGAGLILAALRPLDNADPFELKKCVEGEGWVVTGGLKTSFAGQDAGKKFAEMMAGMGSLEGEKGAALRRAKVEVFDERALHADLDKGAPYYRGVLDAWDRPDALERLAVLEKQMAAGDFGVAGQIVSPVFTKALDKSRVVRKQIKDTIMRLEAVR